MVLLARVEFATSALPKLLLDYLDVGSWNAIARSWSVGCQTSVMFQKPFQIERGNWLFVGLSNARTLVFLFARHHGRQSDFGERPLQRCRLSNQAAEQSALNLGYS